MIEDLGSYVLSRELKGAGHVQLWEEKAEWEYDTNLKIPEKMSHRKNDLFFLTPE